MNTLQGVLTTSILAAGMALSPAAAKTPQQDGTGQPPKSQNNPSTNVGTGALDDAKMTKVDKRLTDEMEGRLAYYNGKLQGLVTVVNRDKGYLALSLGRGEPVRVPLTDAKPTNQGTVSLTNDPSEEATS